MNLRKLCVKKYGEEFGKKYDSLNRGIPIGNLEETIDFINKVEEVKADYQDSSLFQKIKVNFS